MKVISNHNFATSTISAMVILSPCSYVVNMRFITKALIFSISILVLQLHTVYSSHPEPGKVDIKSHTFVSEKLESGPGFCVKKDFYDIEFPKGHIGIKSFDAELVDDEGKPVPLHETYLHHWFAIKYHQKIAKSNNSEGAHEGVIFKRNSGSCSSYDLPQYWGLGSDSRGTIADIPEPFAIEAGYHKEIPDGYEEKWMFNIMTIDTRGVQDRDECTQCRCNLYNVTKDLFGAPLTPDYKGGFRCCYDNTQCKLKEGFQGPRRSLHLKYTIKWVEWDKYQVPVKVYILDSTDKVVMNGSQEIHTCKVEYSIIPEKGDSNSIHVQKANIPIKKGGYLIYGVPHQHAGSVGSTLYGEDGRTLCTSKPTYGTGTEVGNEEGYVVAMPVCLPEPGSVKINDNETLTIESRYKNTLLTGLMGHFYILVAEKLPNEHHGYHQNAQQV